MNEPPPIPPEVPAENSVPGMSLVGRLANVFAVPGEVFESLKASPPSVANWLVPTLILSVMLALTTWVINLQPAVREQNLELQDRMFKKMVEHGRMTQEQADQASKRAEAGNPVAQISQVVGGLFGGVVATLWSGFFIWLGGAVIMRGRYPFLRALEVAGLAGMIAVLGALARALLVMVTGNLYAGATPAMFIKDVDPFNTWHAALMALNLFTVWQLGVQSIGIAKLAGVSLGKAAAWMFGSTTIVMIALFAVGALVRKLMGFG